MQEYFNLRTTIHNHLVDTGKQLTELGYDVYYHKEDLDAPITAIHIIKGNLGMPYRFQNYPMRMSIGSTYDHVQLVKPKDFNGIPVDLITLGFDKFAKTVTIDQKRFFTEKL